MASASRKDILRRGPRSSAPTARSIGNPDMGAPVLGGPWIADDALNAFDIDEGRPPAADDEVVIDVGSLAQW